MCVIVLCKMPILDTIDDIFAIFKKYYINRFSNPVEQPVSKIISTNIILTLYNCVRRS